MWWIDHPRGRVWAGRHERFGPVVFDPADQAGVPPNCVRLFIAFEARTAVCLREHTRALIARSADAVTLRQAVDAYFRTRSLRRPDPPHWLPSHVRPAVPAAVRRPVLVAAAPADGRPICRRCRSLIPAARLEAVPHATLCVMCQAEAERDPTDANLSGEFCPRCAANGFRSQWVWKRPRDGGQLGEFLGCSRYPHCHYKVCR
ncbi:MAG: TraR/DksA C4-type zinc finger protein [Gemmataceae bacterium]|nr:TraR/DksA C4-type zinc finger protein [Gemmataceae bacterium]